MGLEEARLSATAARLAPLGAVSGTGWAAPARAGALERLQAMGLPHRRDEYWKYTDPATLNAATAAQAAPGGEGASTFFAAVDALKLVFVDGVFDPEASDTPAEAGLEIVRLADTSADAPWAAALYGTLEQAGQSPVARPFAVLNTAFAPDGVLIRATGKAARPVSLVYLHENEASDAMLHHIVRIEPGAEVTLLEAGPAAARLNTVLEVDVAEGGAFHHIRAQGRDPERRAITHMFVRVAAHAAFKSFTMGMNGLLTRNEAVIEFVGDDAVAHIAGAAMGDGTFHHDDTVFITHGAERCESRQVFKKVLRNGAVGVFQGKILVKQGAQKTDGYQISQSLLLDDDSQFLAKPELEIYADDVACSHGSTSGAIDEEALFYLRSRGVPQAEATDLLVLSFLAEAVEEIEDDALRDEVTAQLAGWLARHRH